MTQVLVVDDSPIDRVLIEGILKKDARMQTRSATSGADALEQLGHNEPDLVVTDLQMPAMDGLELVTAVRIHYPRVPVVLVTAHGSEELAVRALEQGAASYVPKSQLAANLLPAVDQVLQLASADRGYEALADCLEYAEFRFRATNDFATTDRLVELVQQLVASVGVCDTPGQVRMGMALEEAFRLAVLQGNLELTPERLMTFNGRHDGSAEMLAERCGKEPFASRRILVHVVIEPAEARFEIAHEGPPLKIAEPPAGGVSPALENPAERSLILMRAFMDEVTFGADGRSVQLVKQRAK